MELFVISSFLLALATVAADLFTTSDNHFVRSGFKKGLESLSQLILSVSITFVITAFLANLMGATNLFPLNLKTLFSRHELFIVLVISPLLITGLANVIALALLVFAIFGVSRNTVLLASEPSVILLIASLSFIWALGGKLSWQRRSRASLAKVSYLEVSGTALAGGSIAVLLFALSRVYFLTNWVAANLTASIPPLAMILALTFLFLSWVGLILGVGRNFTALFLTVPTLFLAHILSGIPAYLLTVPFCIAISVSINHRNSFQIAGFGRHTRQAIFR